MAEERCHFKREQQEKTLPSRTLEMPLDDLATAFALSVFSSKTRKCTGGIAAAHRTTWALWGE